MTDTVWAKTQKEKFTQYINQIATATDEAAKSEAFQKWTNAFKNFHSYSLNNMWLIMLQRPDATRCASKAVWAKLGRTVFLNARGAYILAPNIGKKIDEATGEEYTAMYGVRGTKTWPYEDTTGEPLPTLDWADSQRSEELESKIMAYAKSIGVTIRQGETGKAMGYSKGGEIVLNVNAGTDTWVHEVTHEILHQPKYSNANRQDNDHTDRKTREYEAEAVAYVVCQYFGIDTGKTASNYLANWQGDSKTILSRFNRIFDTAKQIVDGIEGM